MADGFRKALFGFNCDDVVEYIRKTHKDFSEKETVLNEKNEELSSSLAGAKHSIEQLTAENEQLTSELLKYREREKEIARVSEDIGRLYLLSQANAKAITETAEENRRIAAEQINKNLETIKAAHKALESICEDVSDTSADFTEKVKGLSSELAATCDKIEINNANISENIINSEFLKESL